MKGMVFNMTLEEFINHLKHKSIPLTLCDEDGKHIFSHVEWQMIGYRIQVDELERSCTEKM